MKRTLQTTLSATLIALAGAAFAQTGGTGPSTSPSHGGAVQERAPSPETKPGAEMRSGSTESGSASGSMSETSAPPQDVVGKDVHGPEGDQIGEIEAIEGNNVIVSVGGFLGMGDRKVALPWNQLNMSGTGENAKITTTMTQDQLKSLPEYKEGTGTSGSSSSGAQR